MARKEDDFTFETIAQVYREERKSTGLTKLPINFYKDLQDYIDRLRESYFKERKNDPTSSKSIMLEDEYNKAEKRASQIYEYRERKITLLALSSVKGGAPNLKLMTEEEKNAFQNLVDTLSKNRSTMLLKKEEDACEPSSFLTSDQKPKEIKDNEGDVEISRKIEEENVIEKGENLLEYIQQENPLLLILEDIPSFVTEERTLNLKRDDVISLPKEVAQILCRHQKARIIKSQESS
jgi:DNA replication initiation complex subunit (GINS family)